MYVEYFFDKDPLKIMSDHSGIVLMCDFDGTLVPIQREPGKCILFPDMKKQLDTIAHTGNSSVVILSGRALSDIKRRVSIEGIYYAGSHGLEIYGPRMRYVHPDALAVKSIINEIRNRIEEEIGNIEGVFIEKKKFTFTLHYRMACKVNKALIRKSFYRILSENSDRQRTAVLKGKEVLELTPNVLWDKGRAALLILERFKKGCLPVYVGDDVTDESVFKALPEDGITIRVGVSKKTAAKYYLRNQGEVLRFLNHVNDVLQRRYSKRSV